MKNRSYCVNKGLKARRHTSCVLSVELRTDGVCYPRMRKRIIKQDLRQRHVQEKTADDGAVSEAEGVAPSIRRGGDPKPKSFWKVAAGILVMIMVLAWGGFVLVYRSSTTQHRVVLIVGESEGVGSLALYTMERYRRQMCGPRQQQKEQEDDKRRVPATHFLYDWELMIKESLSSTTTREEAEQEILQAYLGLYRQCPDNDSMIRIDATWADVNYPDTVDKVYQKLLAKDQTIRLQIFIVLPQYALQQMGRRNYTTTGSDGHNLPSSRLFGNCVGNRHGEAGHYTYGFVDIDRQKPDGGPCTMLASRWWQLFNDNSSQQVWAIPCEYIRANLTGFANEWQRVLGVHDEDVDDDGGGGGAPDELLEDPLEPVARVVGDDTASIHIWTGRYTSEMIETDRRCMPHQLHRMQGNVSTLLDSNGSTKSANGETFVMERTEDMLRRLAYASSLNDTDRVMALSLSGYYYYVLYRGDKFWQSRSMTLKFHSTRSKGVLNIVGTSRSFGVNKLNASGTLTLASNELVMKILEFNHTVV